MKTAHQPFFIEFVTAHHTYHFPCKCIFHLKLQTKAQKVEQHEEETFLHIHYYYSAFVERKMHVFMIYMIIHKQGIFLR